MNPLIDELRWRGMIQDIMPGTEEQLNKEITSAYIGFDPTADSLHIGSLVPILLLVHLQKAGHKPIALVGGATGMVGDPSGKSEERNLLSEEVLLKNAEGVKAQLARFLDFSTSIANAAEMVNNYNWFKDLSFLDFIRDTGKHITVNYMMSKDSVKKRLEGEAGMSFTEFTYQLVQGYDYYWLNKNKNCKLQMGGSDQWGNIVTGTELIRRKSGGEGFAFTCPLITRADGGKFGKSEKGNIWLDAARTSPYEFYQFWLNASDTDAEKWIRIFTFLTRDVIESISAAHAASPGERKLQKTLARELTVFVHGEEEFNKAVETTAKLFSGQQVPVENLTEDDLNNIEGIIKTPYPATQLRDGIDVITFLTNTKIFPSKGEARKMVQNGGVSINRKKIEDVHLKVEETLLLHNKFLLIQKGKKHYYLVTVE
ncbi:MAG TPA: tyrosine--tRNA ligase [Ferruginibacter sp.]|nr:tyrosine--tRNA ligase [Ferruginibacter sp.]